MSVPEPPAPSDDTLRLMLRGIRADSLKFTSFAAARFGVMPPQAAIRLTLSPLRRLLARQIPVAAVRI